MQALTRCALCLIFAIPAVALGQTPPVQTPPGGQMNGPVPPERLEQPGKTIPGSGMGTRNPQRDGAAIVPPATDPGMTKQPPDRGSRMPVIPPPGSPDSGSTVQPK